MKIHKNIITISCLLTLFGSDNQIFASQESLLESLDESYYENDDWGEIESHIFSKKFCEKFRIGRFSLNLNSPGGLKIFPLYFSKQGGPLGDMKKLLVHCCGDSVSWYWDGIFQTSDGGSPFSEKFLEQVSYICDRDIVFFEVGSSIKKDSDRFEKLTTVGFNGGTPKASSIKCGWFNDENIVQKLSSSSFSDLFERGDDTTIMLVYHKGLGKIFRFVLCDAGLEQELVSEELFELVRTPGATEKEIMAILWQINSTQWENVLARKNENGQTLLHVVAKFENSVVFLNTMAEILHGQLFNFLEIEDKYGNTPLHVAAWPRNGAIFLKTIARILPQDRLVSLLELKDEKGNTPLHKTAEFENGILFLKIIANTLPEQLVNFLNIKNNFGEMPLHMAAWYAHGAAFLNEVAEFLPRDQLLTLLSTPDGHGRTPEHLAMRSKNGEAFLSELAKISRKINK
jgi:hypothetical protein